MIGAPLVSPAIFAKWFSFIVSLPSIPAATGALFWVIHHS